MKSLFSFGPHFFSYFGIFHGVYQKSKIPEKVLGGNQICKNDPILKHEILVIYSYIIFLSI